MNEHAKNLRSMAGVAVTAGWGAASEQLIAAAEHIQTLEKQLASVGACGVSALEKLHPGNAVPDACANDLRNSGKHDSYAEMVAAVQVLPTYRPVWLQFGTTMHRDVAPREHGWLRRPEVIAALNPAAGPACTCVITGRDYCERCTP